MRNKNAFQGNIPSVINQNNFGNQKQIQNFNNQSIYTKGFNFTTQPNTTNEESINLGGKARFLHGIVVFFDPNFGNDQDLLSLVINSEQLIDNVIWQAYNPQGAFGNIFKERQFFPLQRKLSGADSTSISLKSVNSHNWYVVFYLSDTEVK